MVALMVAGCEKEYEAPGDQPVYFEYHYENWAWGHQERGWLIDGDGAVRAYDFPEKYRLPDSAGYLSAQDLVYNLSMCDTTLQIIDPSDLNNHIGLISGAATGEIGEEESVAFDAGSSVLSCYLYDPELNLYQYVFLASSGDWKQINDSRDAKILVNWIKGLGEVFWLSD